MWKLRNEGINDLNISLHTTSEIRVRGRLYRRRDCVMVGPGQEILLGELTSEELMCYEPYKQLKCKVYEEKEPIVSESEPEVSVSEGLVQEPEVEAVVEEQVESEPEVSVSEPAQEPVDRDDLENLSKKDLWALLKQKGMSYKVTESREALIEKLRGEK